MRHVVIPALLLAVASLCGCATTAPVAGGVSPYCQRYDCEKIAHVNAQARKRYSHVYWVDPPPRKAPEEPPTLRF